MVDHSGQILYTPVKITTGVECWCAAKAVAYAPAWDINPPLAKNRMCSEDDF